MLESHFNKGAVLQALLRAPNLKTSANGYFCIYLMNVNHVNNLRELASSLSEEVKFILSYISVIILTKLGTIC